jgi:hypothetical protein
MTDIATNCVDEGCPHYGTNHVHVNELPAEVQVEPGVEETPEAFALRRYNEIQAWLGYKANAATAVADEMTARLRVAATCFKSIKKGTNRQELGQGYSIKLVHTLNYTLGDKDKLNDEGRKVTVQQQANELEAKIASLGPAAQLIAERLIRWKPELVASEYEALDPEDPVQSQIITLVNEMLTVKPATPQLTFEEPKPAKGS